MVYIVGLKNSIRSAGLLLFLAVILYSLAPVATVAAQSGTSVNAVLCNPGSTVTLSQPVSDSTVVDPTVQIAGQATQASQVEVYVNDQFDGVISLPAGQSTFNGTVTLTNGTSTIKVVAIDFCQLNNGEATSVVTFTPPPDSTGSNGNDTQTSLPGQGVVIGGDYDVSTEPVAMTPFSGLIPPGMVHFFDSIADWLNITRIDNGSEAPKLTFIRAVVIATGSWLLAFGLATTIVQWISTSVAALQGVPKRRRLFVISMGARLVGFGILVAGIFL